MATMRRKGGHRASAGTENGWPSHVMTVEERKACVIDQITLWVGNQRLDQALKAEELGQLKMIDKMVALRSSLIVGCIRHCHLNPRADSRLSILTLITFLADNSEGTCYLSVTAMTEILQRSREAIVNGIKSLEEQGQIGVVRKNGMPSRYWPLIPAALAEMAANPAWLTEALRASRTKTQVCLDPQDGISADGVNRSSVLDQSSELDRSGGVDSHQSSPVDEPVKSARRTGQVDPCSISTPNSASHPEEPTLVEDEAIALYNHAALEHGFTACLAFTDSRRKRLAKRLAEIGGVQAFARALSAIPRMPYLIGRAIKPGQSPFLLDLDKLLSTDTRMGDVLARLLDLAGQDNGPVSSETEAQRKVRLAVGEENWARFQASGPDDCGHA